MKRFLRRLLGPFLNWLSTNEGITFGFGECPGGPRHGPRLMFLFHDGLGLTYLWKKSPDEVRTLAWKMISAADEVEAAAESRRW